MERDPVALRRETVDGQPIEFAFWQGGDKLVVLLHGGHFRAGIPLGAGAFVASGWSVLQPSRPGYGGTPLTAGPDPAAFADRLRILIDELGFRTVCAAGISAGGRTALQLAARHPDLVDSLVLESAIGFHPWPDPVTRRVAGVLFAPGVERVVWAATAAAFRIAPRMMLRSMMGSLSTLTGRQVTDALSSAERRRLVRVFRAMRSGNGFRNDLRPVQTPRRTINQPALVVASRHDGSVHAHTTSTLAAELPNSVLVWTDAESHFLWVGPAADQERTAVLNFLRTR